MLDRIGIRREDKNVWERRVPLTPEQVRALVAEGVEVVVQPSPTRVYPDGAYREAGAKLQDDLSDCPAVLAIKEVPASLFRPGAIYLFFSHTIKGQKHNMPMLRRLLEAGASLVDYEKVTDAEGRRLLFFGRHAGLAGMIDTLWALGRRLEHEGLSTPFAHVQPAHRYTDLEHVRTAFADIAREIRRTPLDASLCPLVVGIAGYGHVSRGAQEILDLLALREVAPEELRGLPPARDLLFKVVFREEHLVRPREPDRAFSLGEYFDHPERYESRFEEFLGDLTVLVNGIYWDARYPRLLTLDWARRAWGAATAPRLKVVGDISCDVEGAVELTRKVTSPDSPVFVFEPGTGAMRDGVEGEGPVVLAIDNLPAEIPAEASSSFGEALSPLIRSLLAVDPGASFEGAGLTEELKGATIAWRGTLTPGYSYLAHHL